MSIYRLTILGAALALGLGTSAVPAQAAFNFSSDDLECRNSLAKDAGKVVKAATKAIGSCYKGRIKQTTPESDDCYDMAVADQKGRVARSQGQLSKHAVERCASSTNILNEYVSCSATCQASLGLSNPLSTASGVADCLNCTLVDAVVDSARDGLGVPDVVAMADDTDTKRCARKAQQAYQKYLVAGLKEQVRCQSDQDEDLAVRPSIDLCSVADPDPSTGKGAKLLAKAESAILDKCVEADLAQVNACDTSDRTLLAACLASNFKVGLDQSFARTFGLETTICPTRVTSQIQAGSNPFGFSETELSVGHVGPGHRLDIPHGYQLSVDVTCPGSVAGACGSCTVDGISGDGAQYDFFTRCKDEPHVSCNLLFQNDPACTDSGLCTYFLGPPLAISTAGTFTTTLNALATDATGTVNPDDGTGQLNLDLRARAHNGVFQHQPAPLCVNDTTPQDGIKDGLCLEGLNDGLPCDIQGFDVTFGNVSLDCPPNPLANISGDGLIIGLALSTGVSSMPFNTPCDDPLPPSIMCACAQCSGDVSLPCNSDQECADAGAGACTTNGGGAAHPRSPNSCDGGTCSALPGITHRGECTVGPDDQFCDGFLRANGRGILSCTSDASCQGFEGGVQQVCPNDDCGSCTIIERRSCFYDPIELTGTPDLTNPILGATFCLPPTSNAAVNSATGSPGPGVVRLESFVERFYD